MKELVGKRTVNPNFLQFYLHKLDTEDIVEIAKMAFSSIPLDLCTIFSRICDMSMGFYGLDSPIKLLTHVSG
jgi:hypothetical protein